MCRRDDSFENPQHMFWLRNKTNNFQLRTLIWRSGDWYFDLRMRMDSPLYIDTTSMGLRILYLKGLQVEVSILCIPVPEGCFNLANSTDPDEMQQHAAFHMGIHCLPKHSFMFFSGIRAGFL